MKEVIRIVVRNKFKTVKISFWSDQMKTLEQLNLKKGEVVIIEDLKKKKTIFLDYSSEANLVRVTTNSELYKRFQDMLPSYLPLPLPKNLA